MTKNYANEAIELLVENDFLTAKQAVEWLKKVGINISRRTIEETRLRGELGYLKVRGRTRYLYRREDLADAFIVEFSPPIHQVRNSLKYRKPVKVISTDKAFELALKLANSGKAKRK